MPRQSTIYISGLNIVSQPHSPQQYIEIMEYISSQKDGVAIRGDDYLLMSKIRTSPGKADLLDGIEGELLKYTKIDLTKPWLDLEKGKAAEQDDSDRLRVIIEQEKKHPNLLTIPFIFYPKTHQLYFVNKHYNSTLKKNVALSPNHVKKFFDTIFAEKFFTEKFESLETTVLPDQDVLKEIFSLPILKKLELNICPPNSDELEEMEVEVTRRLTAMNVKQVKEEYTANRSNQNGSITPDDTLKKLTTIASRNGYVKATGKDNDNATVNYSTLDHPMSKPSKIQSKSETLWDALRRFRF